MMIVQWLAMRTISFTTNDALAVPCGLTCLDGATALMIALHEAADKVMRRGADLGSLEFVSHIVGHSGCQRRPTISITIRTGFKTCGVFFQLSVILNASSGLIFKAERPRLNG